eukprot:NODE_5512_length_1763_cov_4.975550.p2 GENE.NODE_5512_length_1763_cov_4.975550~~NODE_5512_length_1763_cov_4.975550.p2  ORF type:complete len:119 (+),score=26.07 NODE_5512_length_1763_cov_4.975550:1139-1495(+)
MYSSPFLKNLTMSLELYCTEAVVAKLGSKGLQAVRGDNKAFEMKMARLEKKAEQGDLGFEDFRFGSTFALLATPEQSTRSKTISEKLMQSISSNSNKAIPAVKHGPSMVSSYSLSKQK